ncbi:MAG: hypothetical protein RR588_03420 [Solibacillus sp.]
MRCTEKMMLITDVIFKTELTVLSDSMADGNINGRYICILQPRKGQFTIIVDKLTPINVKSAIQAKTLVELLCGRVIN